MTYSHRDWVRDQAMQTTLVQSHLIISYPSLLTGFYHIVMSLKLKPCEKDQCFINFAKGHWSKARKTYIKITLHEAVTKYEIKTVLIFTWLTEGYNVTCNVFCKKNEKWYCQGMLTTYTYINITKETTGRSTTYKISTWLQLHPMRFNTIPN